jgi:TonB family protein
MEMALGRDAIALPIVERTGSLWITVSAETATAATELTENSCPNLEPPQAERKIMPSYSREAFLHKLSGAVDVEALVHTDGTVRSVQIVRSSDVRFEPEALRAAAEWTFRPARCGNENVSATTLVQLPFNRK